MAKKRILVVDDSCLFQRLLSDVVNAHDQLEVVGVAANGKVAIDLAEKLKPELITLDILMPEMDGIQTLIQLRKKWPDIRTIMISSLTSKGSDAALDALALGASEYVAKPASTIGVGNIRATLSDDLLPKIEALCGLEKTQRVVSLVDRKNVRRGSDDGGNRVNAHSNTPIDLVAIGVSTGGPDALTKLFTQLPADLGVPIVVVQHMPPSFTAKLALRLDTAGPLKVCEAIIGDKLRPGTVYIAPGDFHMVLDKIGSDVIVNLNKAEPENSCRPAVDPLFSSIPAVYGSRCLGVIMTGMGQDGLRGSEALVKAGCSVIVQDKHSSVVWGMPKLVSLAGLADEEVPLDKMAATIAARVRGGRGINQNRRAGLSDRAGNSAHYHEQINSRWQS